MAIYFDTSLIVAALSQKAMTSVVQVNEQIKTRVASDQRRGDHRGVSWLDGLAMHRAINLEPCAIALAMFNKVVFERLTVLLVVSKHFRAAAKFVDQHALGLCAGDAPHLAFASDQAATAHTLDRQPAGTAPVLGVPTRLRA